MQRRKLTHPVTSSFRFACKGCGVAMLVALMAAQAAAAEFGDVTVHSFAGQPLVADIALTALTPDELIRLQVRLASPDVYRAANVRSHPALASLRMTVMQEEGQRQFVHVTTRQAIDADYLHLFLELGSGERHSVRAVTVWLSAKPAPVAPVAPAAPVALVAGLVPVAPAAMPAPDAVRAAREPTPASDMKLALELRSQTKRMSTPEPKPRPASRSTPKPKPKPKPSPEVEANRARAEQQSRDNAALDVKNAALRTKIDMLEEKVAVLQQNHAARLLASRPAAALPAPVPAPAGWPSWIGAASALLLLIVSGMLAFLYRKKITGPRHWMALRRRLRRKAVKPAAPVVPLAPTEPD